jgi:hypothetical protein
MFSELLVRLFPSVYFFVFDPHTLLDVSTRHEEKRDTGGPEYFASCTQNTLALN